MLYFILLHNQTLPTSTPLTIHIIITPPTSKNDVNATSTTTTNIIAIIATCRCTTTNHTATHYECYYHRSYMLLLATTRQLD